MEHDLRGEELVGRTVQIDFRKWPNTKHYQYPMEYLGRDEYGHWLWAPSGTVSYRGDEGPLIFEHSFVKLVSTDWWAANFISEGRGAIAIYVDIATPAIWGSDKITMIDLDLDVEARPDGEVLMLDEDEFAENQVLLGYPPDMVSGATSAARRIYEAVTSGREPFRTIGGKWLTEAIAHHDLPAT